jgi:hypothetical protein
MCPSGEEPTSSPELFRPRPLYVHSSLMPSYHVVAESQHELQDPTSPGKIRLLGEARRRARCGGDPDSDPTVPRSIHAVAARTALLGDHRRSQR